MITFISFDTGGDARVELSSGHYGCMEVSYERISTIDTSSGVGRGRPTKFCVLARAIGGHATLSRWYVAGFDTDGTDDKEDFETALNLCRARVGRY